MSNEKNKEENHLKIIPIGGLDHIGRNMTVFEYGENIIIVDCGIMFPTPEMPGIDFIIPDFTYVRENRHKIKGIILTHGHEDHLGGVPFLLQEISTPVYATKLTLGLLQTRLTERQPREKAELVEISAGQTVKLGCFSVEFIQVSHSIVDSVALAVTTPAGIVIHTGDFKIDHNPVDGRTTNLVKFAEYGEKGVLLLMSDSTNAEKPGYSKSESSLNDTLFDIFSGAKGRIIVATFSTNINRIQQVLNAAQRYNRKVIISGRAMRNNVDIAKKLGYLKFREEQIVDISETKVLPDKKITIICTGSQGEPESALSRISNGTHHNFVGSSGDSFIITASIIPGNERSVGKVVNSLMKMGASVNYEQTSEIHVSGHASQEELKMIIGLVQPKYFMPIHGEHKQLRAHADLAAALGIKQSRIMIADNGDVMKITHNSFERSGKIDVRTVFVDGDIIDNIDSALIKDRLRISSDGIIFLSLVFSEGFLISEPLIAFRGFAESGNEKLINMMKNNIMNTINRMMASGPSENEIKTEVRKNLKNAVFKKTRRNPLIEILVAGV